MSKTWKDNPYSKQRSARQRDITVRAVLRDEPDARRLARVLRRLVSEAQAAAASTDPAADGGLSDVKHLTNREVRTFPEAADD
jgi:hypothetical protein